jgi:hypothetical protein
MSSLFGLPLVELTGAAPALDFGRAGDFAPGVVAILDFGFAGLVSGLMFFV